MNIEKLDGAKIINGIMLVEGKNGNAVINFNHYDKNGNLIGGTFEQFDGENSAKVFFDESSAMFPRVAKMYGEYKIKEEQQDFVKECLLREGVLERCPIVEINSSLENSIAKKIVREGQTDNIILVNSCLSYSDCQKIGFTNVIAGEVLTGNRTIWTCDHGLRDRKGVEHPNLEWALDKKENLSFNKSTLLCLSRRKDIRKLVGQFSKSFIGYYGNEDSNIIKWCEEFYKKELGEFIDKFETFEETATLSDDSKFVLRLFMKK